MSSGNISLPAFARRVLIVLGVLLLALVLWRLTQVVLLGFASILLAVLIAAAADPIARRTQAPRGIAVIAISLVLLGFIAFTGWLLVEQLGNLSERLAGAWNSLTKMLQSMGMSEHIRQSLQNAVLEGKGLFSRITQIATSFTYGLAYLLVVLFGAVYLAVQPRMYQSGILLLLPARAQSRGEELLTECGTALRLWLVGQLISMVTVGVLTGIGLWLLDVPSALALGLVIGLADFVPLAGPVIGAIPGLLIALTVGPYTALWTLVLYTGIQQLEGNLLVPLIERRMVSLPPALTLFAVVAMGVIFGPLGIILAAPMTVVLFVAVRRLWVHHALGHTIDPITER